ncbi:asparagine--tRNA ligase [candidate division WOR-3 bacterium]|nr:asparagine--tRNA ligase [candidate division WOR-3 bacterium]
MRISDISVYEGKDVIFFCWLTGKRSSGPIHFLQVRDGSGFCQLTVVKGEVSDETFDKCGHLAIETAFRAEGKVLKQEKAKFGYEVALKNIEIISEPSGEYPIPRKPSGPDFLLSMRHLWIRSPKQSAVMRIRSGIIHAIRDYFRKEDFFCVDTPIFTPSACEGTTTLFKVEYFDTDVFLSQSGQLYNEANALALEKVYCFGPVFRAEKSKTRRHLTEFWQVEPEWIFADIESIMENAQNLILHILERILEDHRHDLEILERDVKPLESVKAPFPRLSYDKSVEMLKNKGFAIEWGADYGAPEETELSKNSDSPICVHRFPAQIKAFYMKTDPENPKLAMGVDVIAPEGYGEIVGGGVREERIEILEDRIKEHNLPKDDFEWYLDLRRYGSVPHGGFGLGLERTVSWICGLQHVRESVAFPRMMDRIKP